MLEQADALATWQLLTPPTAGFPIECIRIKDHRKAYLDYQGPVSGGRGVVSRVDRGGFQLLGVDDHSWMIHLSGEKIIGEFGLTRLDGSQTRWTMTRIGVMRSDS